MGLHTRPYRSIADGTFVESLVRMLLQRRTRSKSWATSLVCSGSGARRGASTKRRDRVNFWLLDGDGSATVMGDTKCELSDSGPFAWSEVSNSQLTAATLLRARGMFRHNGKRTKEPAFAKLVSRRHLAHLGDAYLLLRYSLPTTVNRQIKGSAST